MAELHVLKESDGVVILGVSFDSKMTSEKHLRSVSRADSQRLRNLRKSWRVFHDRSLLERCFLGFVVPVLEYCSAVLCSAADKHIKLLYRAVSGARFLICGFQEKGQCFFIDLSCSLPTIVFYYSSLSFHSVYRLVLWGWGFRTDSFVYHSLSALHCPSFLIIIIIAVSTCSE